MNVRFDLRKVISNLIKNLSWEDYLVGFAVVLMALPVFYSLATMGWKSADYDHGIFILPISLWLIWRKRALLEKRLDISKTGVVLFVIGILVYLYGCVNDFMFLRGIAFMILMWAVFKLRLTDKVFKAIFFPLAYLIFLIPPPGLAIDSVTFPLKSISTLGSYWVLKLFHLPVQVTGAILKIGDHELFIADACSGFRSMSTLLALGALFAYLQETTRAKKTIIFLAVIPLGIIGNIVRIVLTAMITYFIGTKYAEGFFHEASGLMLFFFTILCLIGLTELMVKRHAK